MNIKYTETDLLVLTAHHSPYYCKNVKKSMNHKEAKQRLNLITFDNRDENKSICSLLMMQIVGNKSVIHCTELTVKIDNKTNRF